MELGDVSPIFQAPTALEIDTPQFCLSLPGTWIEEQPTANHVVYCGRSGNRWVSISIILFTKQLTLEERKKALTYVLEARKRAEFRVSEGEAEVEFGPPYDDQDLAAATAFSVNPSMGLVSFTRLIADSEKILSIYWQVDGLSEPPQLTQLLSEFENVVVTAGLYSQDAE